MKVSATANDLAALVLALTRPRPCVDLVNANDATSNIECYVYLEKCITKCNKVNEKPLRRHTTHGSRLGGNLAIGQLALAQRQDSQLGLKLNFKRSDFGHFHSQLPSK
ncbi:hypothetical protein ACLKA7_014084 [Drosophila subpalustris]